MLTLILIFPLSSPAALPTLPNFHQPKQNLADNLNKKSKSTNPSLRRDGSPCTGRDVMAHPVQGLSNSYRKVKKLQRSCLEYLHILLDLLDLLVEPADVGVGLLQRLFRLLGLHVQFAKLTKTKACFSVVVVVLPLDITRRFKIKLIGHFITKLSNSR